MRLVAVKELESAIQITLHGVSIAVHQGDHDRVLVPFGFGIASLPVEL